MSIDQTQRMGPHDVGGLADDAIDTADYGMTYWEKHANALMMVVANQGLATTDERRRYIESLGDRYYQLNYFERHSEALANVLCERGWISDQDLDRRTVDIKKRFDESPKITLPELPEGADHNHEHFKEDETGEGLNSYHLMNLAVLELLQQQGQVTTQDVTEMIEGFDSEFPSRGATVVVKAWKDADFRKRLFADAKPAIEELDIDLGRQARIIALENTPDIHNVVVCTLCSCYPRFLMGHPPTWYKSRSYRSRVVHEPRTVLKEFGTHIPDHVKIRVHDSNADMRYIVIPMRPSGTENWTDSELEAIVTRDCLVGVAIPRL